MRSLGRLALVFLLGQGAACFRSPDVAKLECTTDPTSCPSGYSCVIPAGQSYGKCVRATAGVDGVSDDVPLSPDAPYLLDGAPAEAGSVRVDVGVADVTQPGLDSVSGPDAPSLDGLSPDLPISSDVPVNPTLDAPGPDIPSANPEAGGGCTVATDCPGPCQTCSSASRTCVSLVNQADPSGKCAGTCDATGACKATQGQTCQTTTSCASGLSCSPDGRCCNRACTGTCESCETGTCQAVTGAPRTGHGSCAGTSTECAGSCTGAADGQCTWPATACGQASCTTLTNAQAQPVATNYVPQGKCNAGSCAPGAAISCSGGLVCASPSACKTSCSSDADCLTGNVCSGGACIGKKSTGSACGASNECQLGNCVDGVCCESSCTAACMACSQAKTGSANGYCRAVTAGSDPDSECAADTGNPCGHDGTCDGVGGCRYQSTSVSCGSASCSGQTYTPVGHCNGAGTCVAGTAAACPNNLPCAGPTCATTCSPLSTTGCPLGYKCTAAGTSCVLATMPCGTSNCPVANGGGSCCITTQSNGPPYIQTCRAPGSTPCSSYPTTMGDPVDVPCHSKTDCPAGQICCARFTGCALWSVRCVDMGNPTDASWCANGSYNSAYQLCDQSLSPSECLTGTCASFSQGDCGPGLYTCQ